MLRSLVPLAATLVALAAAPEARASTAERLVRADAALQAAIAHWQGRGPIPPAVSHAQLAEQRLELALASSQRLAAATIPRLPPALRARVRDDLAAHEELARLTPPQPLSAFKTGPAPPANELLADFRRAELRFGVPWNVLAAVNLVESGFGRVRNASVSGAQGPMQFLPATWRAYGLGGDVHDPADAILGAANYLHTNGAPRNTGNALYHYNPSRLYVDAVLRFAREIRGNYLVYYSRHVFARTPSGVRRLTAAGRSLSATSRRTRRAAASPNGRL
jgi:membrane-bound lytic murein transglycosylase B